MHINDLLLAEFDEEMKKTSSTVERVPQGKDDFVPHTKSMPLGRLAPHVAQLVGFGYIILTTPALDFSNSSMTPLQFESGQQLARVVDASAAKVREALKNMSDAGWEEKWKLSFGGNTIFEGTRFLAYREMFLNHIVHHRAQLGVYLRLNGAPVPATYGPSADEALGVA